MVKEIKRMYFFGVPVFLESKSEIASLVGQLQELAQVDIDSYFINSMDGGAGLEGAKLVGLNFTTKKERNAFKDSKEVREFYVKTMEEAVHKRHLSAWVAQPAATVQ